MPNVKENVVRKKVVPYPYAGQVVSLVVDKEVSVFKLVENEEGTFDAVAIGGNSNVDLSNYATKAEVKELIDAIERLITEEQVFCFYVGGYGGFDRIAATAVKQAKLHYPEISLMLVLPYHPAERPVEAPYGFDGTYYPEGLEKVPRRFAM